MKKALFILAAVVILGTVSHAYAADCSIAGECPSNGDPQAVVQAWGLTGAATPKVAAGTVITDAAGLTDKCPTWYFQGCFNLTSTSYYQNQMRALVKELTSKGILNQFPQLQGWIGK